MTPNPDPPHPPHDRIPFKRLALGLLVLIAAPIILILNLVSTRSPQSTPNPSSIQPDRPNATQDAHPRRSGHRPNNLQPQPRRSGHRPNNLQPQPRRSGHRPDNPEPPVWSARTTSLHISTLNPWPPAPPSSDPPTPTALPAPPGTRFWLLSLELTCNLPSGANFFVTDTPHRLATARLQYASERLSPIGRPADTPDLLTPFTFQKTLQVSPLSPPLRLNLTFCIPTDWPQAQLLLDNQPITTIRPPNPTPASPNLLLGLWSKMQRQRLPLRHPNPLIAILSAPNHRIVAIQRTLDHAFSIQFPLTDITTELAQPDSDAHTPTLRCQATTTNQSQTLQLRLTNDTQHLILYVKNQPTNPITYQRLR